MPSAMNPTPEKSQAPAIRNQEAAIAPDVIGSVVSVIVQNCDPERIILFGSAATGRTHQGSDLDLLVVMDSILPRHKRAAPIRLLFSPYPCPMGHPGVYTNRSQEVAGHNKPYLDGGSRSGKGRV